MNVIQGNDAEENLDSSFAPERYMVVRSSIKSKLPPTLIIKSTNLRVLDPIGQGTATFSTLAFWFKQHKVDKAQCSSIQKQHQKWVIQYF